MLHGYEGCCWWFVELESVHCNYLAFGFHGRFLRLSTCMQGCFDCGWQNFSFRIFFKSSMGMRSG